VLLVSITVFASMEQMQQIQISKFYTLLAGKHSLFVIQIYGKAV